MALTTASPLMQGAPFMPGVSNLRWQNNATTPNKQLDVTADTAMTALAAGGGYIASTISFTINLAASGANGLDTGTLSTTAATQLYGYIIMGPSGVAGLASTSATAPTLPTGYTSFFRCMSFRTDATGNLYRYLGRNRDVNYVVVASTNTAALPVFASGTAGTYSDTAPVFAAVAVQPIVPPTAAKAKISLTNGYAGNTGSGASNIVVAPNGSYSGWGTTTPPLLRTSSSVGVGLVFEVMLETANIYWASSGNGGALSCVGWVENW